METHPSSARPVSAAILAAREAIGELGATDTHRAVVQQALGMGEIVASLAVDEETVLGALAAPLLHSKLMSEEAALRRFGEEPVRLARELARLGRFGLPPQWNPGQKLSAGLAEALRKMLLAIVTDPRLILLRLAEQLYLLRQAKHLPPAEQRRIALEAREIYAPLANRLGVWQLKWELEDLSFRYLDDGNYRNIAAALKSRRTDRESYIEDVKTLLSAELKKAGVQAEVSGRPKHIHSIWRKMQQKHLAFEQVLDVRAVRVLVDSVADCYAALGVVHGLWPYIKKEFDDYIATPKDNLYRSLHTAVYGPENLPLEVQIRTREMHEHAELGVAAHWKYKEGGARDAAYEAKIKRLRLLFEPPAKGQDFEPSERKSGDGDFIDRVQANIFEDRIYAFTPKGDVIDLPKGATPLDFAYYVHTELGHRCRGAKVDGRMVSLDYKLVSGQTVEIVTRKEPQPSRDWLSPRSGFLASKHSRGKVRSWFRKLEKEQERTQKR